MTLNNECVRTTIFSLQKQKTNSKYSSVHYIMTHNFKKLCFKQWCVEWKDVLLTSNLSRLDFHCLKIFVNVCHNIIRRFMLKKIQNYPFKTNHYYKILSSRMQLNYRYILIKNIFWIQYNLIQNFSEFLASCYLWNWWCCHDREHPTIFIIIIRNSWQLHLDRYTHVRIQLDFLFYWQWYYI